MRRLTLVSAVLDGWSCLIVPALFGAGLVVLLVTQPIVQNADGLIGTLFSIQKMTLFFWGQDRFANLLPLLGMPVRDPHWNALAQLVLRAGLGLMAPLFFCVLATRDAASAWRAAAAASTLFLAFAPRRMVHEALIEASPYGTSFALAALALLLFRHAWIGAWRPVALASALALTCTAYLVNLSLILITAPLLLLEAVVFGSLLAVEFGLASLVAVGVAAVLMAGAAVTGATTARFGETTVGLVYFGRLLLGRSGWFILGNVAMVPAVAGLLRFGHRRAGSRAFVGHGAILVATFAVSLVLVSLSSWVVLNYLHPRYLVPGFLLMAALGGLSLMHLVHSLTPSKSLRSAAVFGACTVLLAISAYRTPRDGLPLHTLIDPARRPVADAVAAIVLERGLDGIAGDYWDVWPAVFQAEQLAHDAGLPASRVFGVTYRGEVRRAEFTARLLANGQLSIACIGGDTLSCNAMLYSVMAPPPVELGVIGLPQLLPDGQLLTILTFPRPVALP